jgi:small subunit ribosomal protein S6
VIEAATSARASAYETIYILAPETSTADAEKVADRFGEVVDRLGGKLTRIDNWGKRRLAYPIRKATRGVFVYVKFAGVDGVVAEVERNLRMLDPVVRYQTILLERDVDLAAIEVDPEEVKFLAVEHEEEEEEEALEQRLGLVPSPRARSEFEDEGEDQDQDQDQDASGDGEVGTAEAGAADATAAPEEARPDSESADDSESSED